MHSWHGPRSPLTLASPFGRPHLHGSNFSSEMLAVGDLALALLCLGPVPKDEGYKKKAWLLAFSEPRGPGAQLQSPTQPRLPAPCWLRSPFSSSGPTSQSSGRAKRPGHHARSPCVFLILPFVWGTEAQKALEPSQPRGGCSEDGQPELWLMGKQNPRGCSL